MPRTPKPFEQAEAIEQLTSTSFSTDQHILRHLLRRL
jgi:hypothetical protein